ncbi:hypothetical protein [Hydrocarboniphaga sp.]|uniref:hypothetical protein n=1 Tax=Hydrocarboniphaga sp. TaxID=2033016 RepID=UPI003D101DD4
MSSATPYAIMLVVCASVATTWYGLRADLPSRFKPKQPAPTVQVSSEDYTRRQPGRPLFAGLSSYASLDQVRREFSAKKLEPEHRLMTPPPDPRYPVHAIDTLTLQHYPLLGTHGRLTLQFFNDRLFEVGYKPDDAAACARALKGALPQLRRDANGRAEHISGSQRVASNVDLAASSVGQSLNTEPYVIWQDLRLIRERDDWDQRFGSLPYDSAGD